MELSLWHIVIMLATVFAVIGAGLWAARSVNSAEGYSLNGRSAGYRSSRAPLRAPS